MHEKKTVALYLRLSQEDSSEGESNSIQNQRTLLHEYLATIPDFFDYTLAEYCDDGVSGVHFNRPALLSLLRDIEKGSISCIVVKDFSRFGRNHILVGEYLEQIFPYLGVRFISVNDHYDSQSSQGKTGGLAVGFRTLLNELYSKDLSQKIRSAQTIRMRSGDFLGSHAPFGYQKSSSRPCRLEIDPPAAKVVRRIFSMAEEGQNASQIARSFNMEKLPPPGMYQQKKASRRRYPSTGDISYWHNSTILRILKDIRYTGCMVSRKHSVPYVGAPYCKRLAPTKWIVVENTHPAIVSKDLFQKLQPAVPLAKRKKISIQSSPLKGLVFCGICGRSMVRHIRTNGAFFACETHRYVPGIACTQNSISEAMLLSLLTKIHRVHSSPLPSTSTPLTTIQKNTPYTLSQLHEQKKIQDASALLYAQFRRGFWEMGAYQKEKASLAAKLQALKTECINTTSKDPQLTKNSLKKQRKPLSTLCEPPSTLNKPIFVSVHDSDHKSMTFVLRRIQVFSNTRIELQWASRSPYSL